MRAHWNVEDAFGGNLCHHRSIDVYQSGWRCTDAGLGADGGVDTRHNGWDRRSSTSHRDFGPMFSRDCDHPVLMIPQLYRLLSLKASREEHRVRDTKTRGAKSASTPRLVKRIPEAVQYVLARRFLTH